MTTFGERTADAGPDANTSEFPEQLVRGYRAFLEGRFGTEQQRFHALATEGQSPRIMLIGCCDSRVPPEVIFDAQPGELFVVRNVANLVPPYGPDGDYHGTSAALEFGIMGLRVQHIVVLGHAQCGGVRAFVESEADPYARPLSPGDFIGKWVKLLGPAYERARGGGNGSNVTNDFVDRLAMESIKQSLANLRTFPCVKTLEERGRLALHGAWFGIMDGKLRYLDERSDTFRSVAGAKS